MTETLLLRIERIRYQSDTTTTASAIAIDQTGAVIPNTLRYAANFQARYTPAPVLPGQWWRATGVATPVRYIVHGFCVQEQRLQVSTAELLRPSGEHVVHLLSTNPAFPGIGLVTARRLWDALGERLYHAMETADHATIATVIGSERAQVVLDGWQQFGSADALRWFQKVGLDLRLARRALDVYGAAAHEIIVEDPYRLLAFGMQWSAVDHLARTHAEIVADDPRRLIAAVENVLYRAFDNGSTWCPRDVVHQELRPLIGSTHAVRAMDLAVTQRVIVTCNGRLHAQGPYLIEFRVADALRTRLHGESPMLPQAAVDDVLHSIEQDLAATSGQQDFTLHPAQRAAVHLVARHSCALITGGAGVGKTTVLSAICRVLESCQRPVYLLALAGRAAKRIIEATGRPAMTIAGFLRNVAPAGIPDNAVLVVDEASMLDVLLAYRLLEAVPASCRLVLLGDPAQLPPVGPGLTLHALVGVSQVPRVELTQVRRFGGDIARAAQAIRAGTWPELSTDTQASVVCLPCPISSIADLVRQLYLQDPTHTQILSCTRTHGPASAKRLNAICQAAVTGQAPQLLVWSDERHQVEDSGLRLGDVVVCTRNLWDVGIQNGSLGRITAVEPVVQANPDSDQASSDRVLGQVQWDDGVTRPISIVVLDAMDLGYAVTVHKAQGSQFHRVIVPVFPARNLDRTLLYTALTRATTQVLLVGDTDAARQAAIDPPHASLRRVALGSLMEAPCSSP